jgi:hypothetical protein
MSVSCRIITGLTIELGRDLTSADFKKLHKLEEKYPELDEYNYNSKDREGKLLLIYDGMSSDFARLVMVDKLVDGGNLGDDNEFIELPMTGIPINMEVVNKMTAFYEEYTGNKLNPDDLKYAMWSQWY